jgi:hypothetical protein
VWRKQQYQNNENNGHSGSLRSNLPLVLPQGS